MAPMTMQAFRPIRSPWQIRADEIARRCKESVHRKSSAAGQERKLFKAVTDRTEESTEMQPTAPELVSTKKRKFISIKRFVGEQKRSMLSQHAQDVLEIVANCLVWTAKPKFFMTDEQCAESARVPLDVVPGARSELIEAGLLNIEQAHSMSMRQPVFMYRFPAAQV
jgi:hypothetical protein